MYDTVNKRLEHMPMCTNCLQRGTATLGPLTMSKKENSGYKWMLNATKLFFHCYEYFCD